MTVTAVITCMTDGEVPFLVETVRSVLQQTVPCRILIVTADTNTSVEPVLGDLRAKVTIKRVAFQRAGIVRNLGAQAVETEWLAFLDGDDTWKPEKIERQLAFARGKPHEAIGARHILVRENGAPYLYGFGRAHPLPSSWMARRELLIREPFLDLPQWEDSELWKRWKRLGVAATMRDHLIYYRVRENSFSSTFSPAKRRKQLLARLSATGPTRWAMRCCSRLMSYAVTPD